jgi:adenosylcobinamide kinase / adenosylcobinamide-phosphate guanylyltransferase
MTNRVTLILGGARSGKSALAEKLAALRAGDAGKVLYVATLQPFDSEMRDRIVQHKASRPASWRTLETPFNLADDLTNGWQGEQIVLLDCLTLWTSNLLLRESELDRNFIEENAMYGEIYDDQPPQLETDREENITSDLQMTAPPRPQPRSSVPPDYARLEMRIMADIERVVKFASDKNCGLLIVSNEVGMGLVPPYPLGRVYRDMLGRANQRLAALADEVFIVFAGIPVELKKLAANLG